MSVSFSYLTIQGSPDISGVRSAWLQYEEERIEPVSRGDMHQLCIKVEEQHIKGSPFSVAVNWP